MGSHAREFDMKSLFIVLVILMLGTVACTSNDDAVNALHQEIGAMKQQIKTLADDNYQLKNSLISIETQPNLEECIQAVFSTYQQKDDAYSPKLGHYLYIMGPYFYDKSTARDLNYRQGELLFAEHEEWARENINTTLRHVHTVRLDSTPPECMSP